MVFGPSWGKGGWFNKLMSSVNFCCFSTKPLLLLQSAFSGVLLNTTTKCQMSPWTHTALVAFFVKIVWILSVFLSARLLKSFWHSSPSISFLGLTITSSDQHSTDLKRIRFSGLDLNTMAMDHKNSQTASDMSSISLASWMQFGLIQSKCWSKSVPQRCNGCPTRLSRGRRLCNTLKQMSRCQLLQVRQSRKRETWILLDHFDQK